MYLRRFGVLPAAQGHGIAAALVEAAVDARPRAPTTCTVVAREELPDTVRFWRRQGFREIRRDVAVRRAAPAAAHLRREARRRRDARPRRRLAGLLRAGDLLVLSGDLGAGKTTFTQGLGAGLGCGAT